MANGIIRPFAGLAAPGPLQVPTGQLTIDWDHPLSRGLLACFVPGVNFVDVCGQVNYAPTFQSGMTYGQTPEGPGVNCAASSGGYFFSVGTDARFSGWSAFSLYYRGLQVSAPVANSGYIAISFARPNATPFAVIALIITGNSHFAVQWNSAGATANTDTSNIAPPTTGKMFSVAATAQASGGSILQYLNAAQVASSGFGASTPNGSATTSVDINTSSANLANNAICNIALFWNRVLTVAELTALDQAPYDFLIPAEYELPVAIFVAPPVFTLMPQIVM